MREIVKLGLVLLLITSIAAIILAFSNQATMGRIAEVTEKANNEARMEVLSKADKFEELDKSSIENVNVLEIYEGYSDNNVVGYTIKTATSGYGGDVQVITGISTEGKITGIKVVDHQETPGLGANATNPEFQNQYKDLPVKKEVVVVKSSPSKENQIQAITGATITSKAVTKGVNIAREVYNKNLSK